MTTSSPPTGQHRSQRRARRGCLAALALLLLLGGVLWRLLDPAQVDRQLRVQTQVQGGQATLDGIVWQTGGGWPLPVAVPAFSLLLVNQSNQALEVADITIVLRDPLLRTVQNNPARFGVEREPVYLGPYESQVVEVVGIGLPYPMTWNQADVTVMLQPATANTRGRLNRWADFTIEADEARPDGSYRLVGRMAATNWRSPNGGMLFPRAVIAFYNAQGQFVSGGAYPVSGTQLFQATFAPGEVHNGPVTRAEVLFIEDYSLLPAETPPALPREKS
jgi:hypothetical protein